ncbi:MAG: hypothetical protein LC746_10930 [Acidobacteria bacterium]|nr:hypothetical protein [Acidobacteriota bacterium]
MIVYRKKFVRVAEGWHGEEPAAAGVDIVRRYQLAEPDPRAYCREFHTILIDLSADAGALFAAMKRGCRYEVRRAEAHDRLAYDFARADDATLLARFREGYDEFARARRLRPLDPAWLALTAETGNLYVSRVCDERRGELVFHSYYLSGGRATLLQSFSPQRAAADAGRARVSRANRLHHWLDVQKFKADGATLYDLGGWYHGTTDPRRLAINRFKEGFGGAVVKNYIAERALTPRGRLFLTARRLLLGDAI